MKQYKIKTEGYNKEILDKAKKLGYNVSDEPTIDSYNDYIYLYKDGSVYFSSDKSGFEYATHPEISVDDFLKFGEKPDAYVMGMHGDTVAKVEQSKGTVTGVSVYDLHNYNLLSQEEYKAKYPDKLQLKGHDVEFLSENFVKIGTVTFHSYMLRLLFRNIKDHGNDPCEFNNVTIEELFHFISKNKEKFGL